MTASPKLKRDYIYLAFFTIHLFSILIVDLPPIYPPALWKNPDSPFRVLALIRQYYADTFRDPFFLTPHHELPSWFHLFTYLEVAVQIPMNLWMWRVFEQSENGTYPLFELACVPYGVEVALTTLTVVWDVAYWDPAVYSVADKTMFIFGIYGPFVAIPLIFSWDMGRRILARIEEGEKAKSALAEKKSK